MPEGLVPTLARLVAEPSVSDRPVDGVAALLAERAEAAGMRVELRQTAPGKVNVIASAGPEGTDGLLLSGHMDVVPVTDQRWTSDPFRLTARGDLLVGRGACDMKGFLAAAAVAVDALPLRRLQRELVLLWTHDEEVGCAGSAALVQQLQAEARAGHARPLPRAAVIGEPTDLRPCRLHPGHSSFAVVCRGRSAHSSRPALGLNAISLTMRAAAVIEAFAVDLAADRAHADLLETPFTLVNLGQIHGGTAINIVPERCELRVGVRPLPGVELAGLLAELERRLAPLRDAARADGGDIELQPLQEAAALLTRPDCAHLHEVSALARAAGRDPTPVGVPFATDGGNLARLGLEPVIFGPGRIDQAHRPDESIPLADLHLTVELLGRLAHQRCVDPPPLG
jgi:acetylornithine deacetylase